MSKANMLEETDKNVIFVVYVAVGLAITSSVAALTAILYRFIRPRFPIRVNCWFCNEDTEVPYGNRECWDCPRCDQYNGFTQDGDYNKPIPAQFVEEFNHPVSPEARRDDRFNTSSDVLCQRCQGNQLLKVKQLANFTPISELTYDLEMSAYTARLEQTYTLCRQCEQRVYEVLDKQDRRLRRTLRREGRDLGGSGPDVSGTQAGVSSHHSSTLDASYSDWEASTAEVSSRPTVVTSSAVVRALTVTAFLLALLLTASCVDNLLTLSGREGGGALGVGREAIGSWSPVIGRVLRTLHHYLIPAAVIELALNLLGMYSKGKKRLKVSDLMLCLLWASIMAVTSSPIATLEVTDLALTQTVLVVIVVTVHIRAATRMSGRHGNIRISTKKSRLSLGDGTLSSSSRSVDRDQSVDHDDHSTTTSDRDEEGEDECFSDFETMSLGAPTSSQKKHKRKHRRNIFSAYTASTPQYTSRPPISQPTSTTSPYLRASSQAASPSSPYLRASSQTASLSSQYPRASSQMSPRVKLFNSRGGIISPARFKHKSAPNKTSSLLDFSAVPSTSKDTGFGSLSQSSVAGYQFGLGSSNNLLFKKNPWANSAPPSQASDDGGSLFSDHRPPPPKDDADHMTHQSGSRSSGSRSSGSACPVGTTFKDPEPQPERDTQRQGGQSTTAAPPPARPPWSPQRPLLVLSVLINVCLLAYFLCDATVVSRVTDAVCHALLTVLTGAETAIVGLRRQINDTHGNVTRG